MFITVRSGASEERLFNLNCQVDAILRDITTRCPYQVEQGMLIKILQTARGRDHPCAIHQC